MREPAFLLHYDLHHWGYMEHTCHGIFLVLSALLEPRIVAVNGEAAQSGSGICHWAFACLQVILRFTQKDEKSFRISDSSTK